MKNIFHIKKRLWSLFLCSQVSIFLLAILFYSCGAGGEKAETLPKKDWLIPEDSLVNLLYDIHMTDAASKQNFFPNNAHNFYRYSQYKTILNNHQITKERFDSTIHLYSGNGLRFEQLYDKVIEKIAATDTTGIGSVNSTEE